MVDYPIGERLPEIACPTLIVWGRNDLLVPVRDADTFEALIPDARKVIFDDTGHVAMLEEPERFNAELRQFLVE
jgi:pimeloyl-ACP methyl ester carboxylesterase